MVSILVFVVSLRHIPAFAAFAVQNVPDALFVPIATSLLTVGVPLLIAKHDALVSRRRASNRQSRVGVSRTEQMLGLLIALMFPLVFAIAWPLLEPALEALCGNQARAVRAVFAPYLAPLVRRGGRALDGAADVSGALWQELSALASSVVGPVPWRRAQP